MAKKKKSGDDLDLENNNDEEKGNGFVGFLLALVIIVIWLVIFALLIKMDVGGIGTMLRPVLKNVPVVNKILPEMSDEELMEETDYKYKSLAEAIERIKELEEEVANYQNSGSSSADQIAELQAEVARLKVYEDNQENFLKEKEEFDNEVAFNDNAPDISEYKSWYETIYPDNAAKIYKEVTERLQFSEQVQDWATTYAKMDSASAAAIMEEMTGDAYVVTRILLCMTPKQRSAIMQEMDPVYAAKLTAIMFPSQTN
jgi:flagellar motility protein MotE (MotC chaperone)